MKSPQRKQWWIGDPIYYFQHDRKPLAPPWRKLWKMPRKWLPGSVASCEPLRSMSALNRASELARRHPRANGAERRLELLRRFAGAQVRGAWTREINTPGSTKKHYPEHAVPIG